MNDKIHIRGLRIRTIIGFHEWEKYRQQDVLVDVTMYHDQRKAAASDHVADTINYAGVRDAIVHYARNNSHGLLETLAEQIAGLVLAMPGIEQVDVKVDKLAALRFADSVAVEIHRP